MAFNLVLSIQIVMFIIFSSTNGQIPSEEIPPEIKFVLDPELGEWKSPEELEKICPYYLSGFDEENRPIWVIEMGVWPTRDILAKGPEWESIYGKYADQFLKRVFDSVMLRSTPANPVREFNVIIDVDNYNIKYLGSAKAVSHTTEKFKLLTIASKFSHASFIVNMNYFGEVVLNLMRPILGKALEKVEIYGTNSNAWIPKMLKILPQNQLSAKYGGNKDFKPIKMYG
ncbi:unnamed protein product [Allacma fusca]|uniref:CRAL-TRIO domain-containing protein n=1 Tax=Allacma fusca TaxID=39272 RepID=A0A8J2P6P3_9HEXA|nr:unnamed protein product [Allacma fusca]